LRWTKRQPTKNELFEQFTELKSSFAISQNSILMMEKRITTLETDIAQLIEYINTTLINAKIVISLFLIYKDIIYAIRAVKPKTKY